MNKYTDVPTPEQMAKLPKWVKDHIENLDRRAVVAERELKEYRDSQTPSPFYVESYDGGMKKHYVQTHKMSVERDGVKLDILLRLDDPGIDLMWSSDTRLVREIAMVPTGFNQVRLLTKDKMR